MALVERTIDLSPLDDFYRNAEEPLPPARSLTESEMPEPYRTLLCHENDMTPTLENAYGSTIHLEVLDYRIDHEKISRRVALVLDDEVTRVEMGAINIYFAPFPPEAREEIRERRKPLGTILHEHAVPHQSRPTGYFEIAPDAAIREALQAPDAESLYGRTNVIRRPDGRLIAEVLEILPPTDPFRRQPTQAPTYRSKTARPIRASTRSRSSRVPFAVRRKAAIATCPRSPGKVRIPASLVDPVTPSVVSVVPVR